MAEILASASAGQADLIVMGSRGHGRGGQPHGCRNAAHAHQLRRQPDHPELHAQLAGQAAARCPPTGGVQLVGQGRAVLTAIALAFWVLAPNGAVMPWACVAAGVADGLRLARWRGLATLREPMLWVLHLGYGWLAIGFLLLGLDTVVPWLPQTTACTLSLWVR